MQHCAHNPRPCLNAGDFHIVGTIRLNIERQQGGILAGQINKFADHAALVFGGADQPGIQDAIIA